jgi:Cof subfamily protein (haloacid dehalogenase superfamily)
MKKIRMVALDMDGTLFDGSGKIPEENKRILREVSEKGVYIVLASGRMTDCMIPTADLLGIDCPIIVYNGAMVRNAALDGRKVIFHKPLPAEYGDKLIDYSLKNHFLLNYYLDDRLYVQYDPSLRKYMDIYAAQTGATFHFVQDIEKFKGNKPTKLILVTDASEPGNFDSRRRNEQYEYFDSVLGGEVTLIKTNPEYIEFMNKEVDKGVGLIKLAEYCKISIEEIIAFGDGDNDAQMLATAGIGIAMANAGEKARRAANIVSKWTNNQAGVAKVLKQYL